MPSFWLQFIIFPVVLFFLSACLVTGLPLAQMIIDRRARRVQVSRPGPARSTMVAKAVTSGD